MIIRSGQMRERVDIQTLTDTQDAQGGRSETWTVFRTVWAAIRPLRGREFLAAQQEQARVTHEIKLRWFSGITPKMRIMQGTREFRIDAVINVDERNQLMSLMCEEVV